MGIESGQLEIIYRFVARIGVSYTARGVCQRSVNGCAPLDPGKMGESDAQDGIRIRVDGVTGRHDRPLHYLGTCWLLDPASRIRTGDIAVAAQFARER